jgi:glycosyltransferase involved in cell wall biosynthesis
MSEIISQPRSIVIPYYNEEQRFPLSAFMGQILYYPEISFILVDDGSTDSLTFRIRDLVDQLKIENLSILEFPKNLGKGSALRAGMKKGLQNNSKVIAFLDADFSTSLEELIRLVEILENSQASAVIGSRISNDSNVIKSEFYRLFFGKIFSAFARRYFQLDLRDTQCGAKAFKVSQTLKETLDRDVIDPWLYDLQLLVPIIKSGGIILEVELNYWANQDNSKFNLLKGICSVLRVKKIKSSFEYMNSNF